MFLQRKYTNGVYFEFKEHRGSNRVNKTIQKSVFAKNTRADNFNQKKRINVADLYAFKKQKKVNKLKEHALTRIAASKLERKSKRAQIQTKHKSDPVIEAVGCFFELFETLFSFFGSDNLASSIGFFLFGSGILGLSFFLAKSAAVFIFLNVFTLIAAIISFFLAFMSMFEVTSTLHRLAAFFVIGLPIVLFWIAISLMLVI